MKLRHAVFALVLTAGVAACGSAQPEPSAAPAPASISVEPSASGGTFTDAEYAAMVRGGTDFWDGVADEKLMANSQLVCDVFEDSLTDDQFLTSYLQLLKSSTDNGMAAGEAGAYITYASAQFCPKQMQRLKNLPGA